MDSKKVYRGKYKISVIVFILLAIVTFILCFQSITAIRQKMIAAKDNVVDSVVVGYFRSGGAYSVKDPELGFYYEYTDNYGKVCRGRTTHIFVYGYEKAEKLIEEKKTIKVYIDNKGNSLPVGAEPSQAKFVTIIVLGVTFLIITVVFFILFLIPKKIENKEDKN